MDEADFDYDDLIDDYIEDSFEPPPEYDDAFLEEMAAAEQPQSSSMDQGNTATRDDEAMQEEPDQEQDVEDMEEDVPSTRVRQAYADRRSAEDLFSFERYKSNSNWRSDTTTNASSPTGNKTMRATAWKTNRPSQPESPSSSPSRWEQAKAGLVSTNHTTVTRAPTAPDAQLLQFLSLERRRPGVTWRLSQRMPLTPVPGQSCRTLTLGDGTRLYARIRSRDEVETAVAAVSEKGNHYALGMSISDLLQRVQAMRRRQEHEKQEQLQRELKAMEDSDDDDDEVLQPTISKAPVETQLWVDKHAPSTFSHLLSDERTNREVVRALREWDPYVFGKEPPKRPEFGGFAQAKAAASSDANKSSSGVKPKVNPKDRRPDENNRVILLSGPPGVGKSTLAHIVARHAGYRPLEVNGSDERTESSLTERVVRAMESMTLNVALMRGGDAASSKPKPNCLIIDEIDGADAKGAVQALVDIIRAEIPPKGSKSKNKTPYLRRPIIFICNNKFVPALRSLLPFCRQFNVSPPSASRLVARLHSVLSEERMSLFGGSSLLHQLVAATCGDIRSCLYTLQFASARAKELSAAQSHNGGGSRQALQDVTLVDISGPLKSALQGDGMKDERNDVAGTVLVIFRKEKAKMFGDSQVVRDRRSSVTRVLDVVQSFGDNSRVLDCLFMNVLRVSYIDPTFDRCSAAHEWLSSSDVYRSFNTSVASNNSSEKFAMEGLHIPSAAAALHLLCRVEQRPDLTYSTRDLADTRYQQEANQALMHKFVEGLAAKARGSRCLKLTSTETVPFALWVLSAGQGSSALDRAASSIDILSEGERQSLDMHVSTLRALGLTYVAAQEGFSKEKEVSSVAVNIRFEPPIERLVNFVDLDLPSHQTRQMIPPAMKELLAQRAAHDSMNARNQDTIESNGDRLQASKGSVSRRTGDPPKTSAPSKRTSPGDGAPPSKRAKASLTAQNFLGIGAKKAKAARSARNAARVGLLQSKKKNKTSHTGSGVPFDQVIRLKYVKGFTQAVRTPCRLEDLS